MYLCTCGETSNFSTCLTCCDRDEFLDHFQILLFAADPEICSDSGEFTMEFEENEKGTADRIRTMLEMLVNYGL